MSKSWYVGDFNQTERYEQEVTINLDQEGTDHGGGGQTDMILQYEELVRKQLNIEISSFFMDYGFHVLNQFFAIGSIALFRFLNFDNSLILGFAVFFGGSILALIVRLIKRKSDSNIKKYIVTLELGSCACIISGLFTFESQIFFIPFVVFSVLALAQIIFYCLNFADSIDQTFVFKLVE